MNQNENAFTKEDLRRFQAETLDQKIQRSFAKISEWFTRWSGQVYVSFSGGKDSTVLADLCAKWCVVCGKTLYLVFVDTGLEYPEIRKHVKEFAEWLRQKYEIEVVLEIIRPKMRFDEVIKKYGYPLITKETSYCIYTARSTKKGKTYDKFEEDSKEAQRLNGRYSLVRWKPLRDSDIPISHMCCNVMKKQPAKNYEKRTGRKPLIATMTEESRMREQWWLKNGCNAFEGERPRSTPMSFWTEQDVLQYIRTNNIPLASVYGQIEYANDPDQMRIEEFGLPDCGTEKLRTSGCDRTGCMFCGFGCHIEKRPTRFERLQQTHPRQYKYCIEGGEYVDGRWQPNKEGLGLGHVFDELNEMYGDDFIKYRS